jgi:hypothetical protein
MHGQRLARPETRKAFPMKTLVRAFDNFDQVNTFAVALPARRNGAARPAKVCQLRNYDGQFEAISFGVSIKSEYTPADIAERQRLAAEAPLVDGETVLIQGAAYRFTLRGDYSDCGYFTAI